MPSQGSKLEPSGDRAEGTIRQSQEARKFVSRETFSRLLLSLVEVRSDETIITNLDRQAINSGPSERHILGRLVCGTARSILGTSTIPLKPN